MEQTQPVAPGLTGGLLWPSPLVPQRTQPEPVCKRSAPDGDQAEATRLREAYAFLPATCPTDLALTEPHETTHRIKIFRQAEAWLTHFYEAAQGSAVPIALLREQLLEAWQPEELWARTQLRGSCLCSARLAQGGGLLLGHAVGAARETPALTVLSGAGDFKCQAACVGQATKHPLLQLAFAAPGPAGHSLASLPLLAARSQYWVTLHQPAIELLAPGGAQPKQDSPAPGPAAGGHLVCRLRTCGSALAPCRISHLAWNPVLTDELAFACTDGSMWLLQAGTGGPGLPNDLTRRCLRAAAGACPPGALACCEWGWHPRLLYCSAGEALLRLDFRDETAPPLLTTRFSCGAGQPIVGICRPDQCSPLLALATSGFVVLLDTRELQPLIKWEHGLKLLLQPMLFFHLADAPRDAAAAGGDACAEARRAMDALSIDGGGGAGPSGADAKPPRAGCIALLTAGEGTNLAFRFERAEAALALVAHPPPPPEDMQGGEEGPTHGHFSLHRAGSGPPGFRWAPHFAAQARALQVPQTLAPRLKQRTATEERCLVFRDERLLDEGSIGILGAAPELCGAALLPGSLPGPDPDSILARLDFQGNIFLDACALLRPSVPPAQPGGRLQNRVLLRPPAPPPPEPQQEQEMLPKLGRAPKPEATQPAKGEGLVARLIADAARDWRHRAQPAGPCAEPSEVLTPREQAALQGALREMQVPLTTAELAREVRRRTQQQLQVASLAQAQPPPQQPPPVLWQTRNSTTAPVRFDAGPPAALAQRMARGEGGGTDAWHSSIQAAVRRAQPPAAPPSPAAAAGPAVRLGAAVRLAPAGGWDPPPAEGRPAGPPAAACESAWGGDAVVLPLAPAPGGSEWQRAALALHFEPPQPQSEEAAEAIESLLSCWGGETRMPWAAAGTGRSGPQPASLAGPSQPSQRPAQGASQRASRGRSRSQAPAQPASQPSPVKPDPSQLATQPGSSQAGPLLSPSQPSSQPGPSQGPPKSGRKKKRRFVEGFS